MCRCDASAFAAAVKKEKQEAAAQATSGANKSAAAPAAQPAVNHNSGGAAIPAPAAANNDTTSSPMPAATNTPNCAPLAALEVDRAIVAPATGATEQPPAQQLASGVDDSSTFLNDLLDARAANLGSAPQCALAE